VRYVFLEAMLANERLDLVEILTPNYLHAPHVIACAKARVKGISLQKPMGLTVRECDETNETIEECQRNGIGDRELFKGNLMSKRTVFSSRLLYL
jgi:predicted dehydrogenase